MEHKVLNVDARDTMNESDRGLESWEPLPAGELGRFVQRRRDQAWNARLRWFAALAAVFLLALGIGGIALWNDGAGEPKLSHEETLALAPDYLAGRLPREEVALVEQHLAVCPDCRAKVERLRERSSDNRRGHLQWLAAWSALRIQRLR